MESKKKGLLIAPCGMNCSVCMAYLRERNKCPGSRGPDTGKAATRIRCKIKTCEVFQKGKAKFCFTCKNFPCTILKHLDLRYQTRYHMSMIENLEFIKKKGIKKFVENEKIRWASPECGGIMCVHTGYCNTCGRKRL